MEHQVVIVQIISNGSDKGVFLDGDLFISADPVAREDSYSMLERVAQKLSSKFDVQIINIEHSPQSDWDWDEVKQDLINKEVIFGKIKKFPIRCTVVSANGDKDMNVSYPALTYKNAVQDLINDVGDFSKKAVYINKDHNGDGELYKSPCGHPMLYPAAGTSFKLMVGNILVDVQQTGEGCAVDLWNTNLLGTDEGCIGSTYAHTSECLPEVEA